MIHNLNNTRQGPQDDTTVMVGRVLGALPSPEQAYTNLAGAIRACASYDDRVVDLISRLHAEIGKAPLDPIDQDHLKRAAFAAYMSEVQRGEG